VVTATRRNAMARLLAAASGAGKPFLETRREIWVEKGARDSDGAISCSNPAVSKSSRRHLGKPLCCRLAGQSGDQSLARRIVDLQNTIGIVRVNRLQGRRLLPADAEMTEAPAHQSRASCRTARAAIA